MEFASPAGVIGAFVGLAIGLVETQIVGRVVERKLRDTDRSQTPAEKADYERRIGWFRRLLFGINVVFFPVVGYVVGRIVAS